MKRSWCISQKPLHILSDTLKHNSSTQLYNVFYLASTKFWESYHGTSRPQNVLWYLSKNDIFSTVSSLKFAVLSDRANPQLSWQNE